MLSWSWTWQMGSRLYIWTPPFLSMNVVHSVRWPRKQSYGNWSEWESQFLPREQLWKRSVLFSFYIYYLNFVLILSQSTILSSFAYCTINVPCQGLLAGMTFYREVQAEWKKTESPKPTNVSKLQSSIWEKFPLDTKSYFWGNQCF